VRSKSWPKFYHSIALIKLLWVLSLKFRLTLDWFDSKCSGLTVDQALRWNKYVQILEGCNFPLFLCGPQRLNPWIIKTLKMHMEHNGLITKLIISKIKLCTETHSPEKINSLKHLNVYSILLLPWILLIKPLPITNKMFPTHFSRSDIVDQNTKITWL